ncbi:MAG: MBL fold metallo-hydrolase [Acidobacteriota bacterium]
MDPELRLEVTVLGCGTSLGVPVIGCECRVCTSGEAKNQRMRSSVGLRYGDRRVLIDTSVDLRQQCLRFAIDRVDAVLFTHAHADHIFGLDDLRPFGFRQRDPIPLYGSAETLGRIRESFAYIFDGQASEGGGKPRLEIRELEGPVDLWGLVAEPLPVWHGSLEVTAYRFGPFAYVTDCHHIPAATMDRLRGVEVLILDALRYRPHATHLSVGQAIEIALELDAGHTYLTHMTHEIDYLAPAQELPAGVELAYDGLTFEIDYRSRA